jgi:hypothetical protein
MWVPSSLPSPGIVGVLAPGEFVHVETAFACL